MSDFFLMLIFPFYMLSGLIFILVPQMVLYVLSLAFFSWRSSYTEDVQGKAILVSGLTGWALFSALTGYSTPADMVGIAGTIMIVIGITALAWIPLGNLIWNLSQRVFCGKPA